MSIQWDNTQVTGVDQKSPIMAGDEFTSVVAESIKQMTTNSELANVDTATMIAGMREMNGQQAIPSQNMSQDALPNKQNSPNLQQDTKGKSR